MALQASDPALLFVAPDGGKMNAFWTPENQYASVQDPVSFTVVVQRSALHPRLRAHMNACPEQHPECVPDQFFALQVPADGQISLRFSHFKGPLIVDLQRTSLHLLYLLFLALLLGGVALLFRADTRLLAGAAVVVGGLYLSISQGLLRGMDVHGHLSHVENVVKLGPIVQARACWECFQPPVYYWLASAFLGFPATLRSSAGTLLQGLALLLYVATVPFLVRIVRTFAASRREVIVYGALACFWPAAVLQSSRLGNDALLDLFVAAVLMLLVNGRIRTAALVAGAAILVKKSAIVVIALVAAMALVHALRGRFRWGKMAFCWGVLAGAVGVSRLLDWYKGFHPVRMIEISNAMRVENTAANLFLMDPLAFVNKAFVNPWIPEVNRDLALNYFWKTSLFGEWNYYFPYAVPLAGLLSCALLALVALALFAWARGTRDPLPALSLALSVAAVLGYRAAYPFACNADFRFVLPTAVFGVSVMLAQARGRILAPLCMITAAGFLALSQLFFLSLWLFEAV